MFYKRDPIRRRDCLLWHLTLLWRHSTSNTKHIFQEALSGIMFTERSRYISQFYHLKVLRYLYTCSCRTSTLCDTVPEVAQKHCPSLLNKARDIQTKFKQVLILFKRCHDICDGNSVSDAQITQLGKLFTILQFVNSTIFYTLQRVTSLNSCPSINKTSLRRPCSLGSKSGT